MIPPAIAGCLAKWLMRWSMGASILFSIAPGAAGWDLAPAVSQAQFVGAHGPAAAAESAGEDVAALAGFGSGSPAGKVGAGG